MLYGKEGMNFVMYKACMKSRNVTSVTTDRNSTCRESRARDLPYSEWMMQWMRVVDGDLCGLFIDDTRMYVGRIILVGLRSNQYYLSC